MHLVSLLTLTSFTLVAADDLTPFQFPPLNPSLLKRQDGIDLLTPFQFSPLVPSLLKRQASCASIGEVACGANCKPPSAICCGGEGTYCPAGNYCDTGGCCRDGKICTGSAGTITNSFVVTSTIPATSAAAAATTLAGSGSSGGSSGTSCPAGSYPCGADGCQPNAYTCCPDGQGGCNTATEVCVARSSGGYGCCPIGKTCSESGGGGGSSGGGSLGPSCATGQSPCGTGCLLYTDTCCPNQLGGCNTANDYCYALGGGAYGCCPYGKVCDGSSGGSVASGGALVSTTNLAAVSTSPASSSSSLVLTSSAAAVVSNSAASAVTTSSASVQTAVGVGATTNTVATVAPIPTQSIARAEANVMVVGGPALAVCGLMVAQVLL